MVVALIAVMLILIGLPLAAWWVGGRRFWGRLRPGAPRDPWGDLMREYRLTGGEMAEVSSALNRGRRLDDERLRRAAVAMAEASLRIGPQWRHGSRGQRLFVLLAIAWVAGLAVGVVLALSTSTIAQVPWFGILAAMVVVGGAVWQRRMARRAIELNSEPGSPGDECSDRQLP